jgi:hypothetical protein
MTPPAFIAGLPVIPPPRPVSQIGVPVSGSRRRIEPLYGVPSIVVAEAATNRREPSHAAAPMQVF